MFSQMRITISVCVVPFPRVNFHISLLSQRYCYCIISNGHSRSVIENEVSLAWCLIMTCAMKSAFYTAVNVHTSYLVGFHRQVRRSECPHLAFDYVLQSGGESCKRCCTSFKGTIAIHRTLWPYPSVIPVRVQCVADVLAMWYYCWLTCGKYSSFEPEAFFLPFTR